MPDLEIKRCYDVLPNNNIRFGIKILNNLDFTISDVNVILDYKDSHFDLEGDNNQHLDTLLPTIPYTAEFILKPLGCIHNENMRATVSFKDQQLQKHTLEMHPKEVHCVCPFLKEKFIPRAEFLTISKTSFSEERGMNYEGINVDKLEDFLLQIFKNRLYNVGGFSIENGRIIYFAGDEIGGKSYYLLTAIVKEYEGLTQLLLRANSDNRYGLNGFLNEILDNLRHITASANARERGIINKELVINIIDSTSQRSSFSIGAASVNIHDGDIQRNEAKVDEKRRKEIGVHEHREKEEQQRKQGKEKERIIKKKEEAERRMLKVKSSSKNKLFAIIIIFGLLAVGYIITLPGPNTGQTNVAITVPHIVYVEIKGSQFNPIDLRIAQGTTVRWTNMDSALHIIKGNDFESPPLNKREMWNYTFDKKGTYNYSCISHPYMPNGKIIVMD